jgi:hypothetical protein
MPLWEGEPTLKAFVDRYNSKQIFQRKIQNNDHLFKLFFDEVKFCYVPDQKEVSSQPQELFQQYRQLGRQIGQAAHKAEHSVTHGWAHSWKVYNVPTFNHVLKLAFDHFSTSDLPFDFCRAARNDYSTPNSPTDHFANFMRHLFQYRGQIGLTQVMELVSKAFAISLVIRELRLKDLGKLLFLAGSTDCIAVNPAELYDSQLKAMITDSYTQYVHRFQTCHFKFENGDTCTKRPFTDHDVPVDYGATIEEYAHPNHFSSRGDMIPGRLEVPDYEKRSFMSRCWERDIPTDFVAKYGMLDELAPLQDITADAQRQWIQLTVDWRAELYQRYRSVWNTLRSNSTCLACLQAIPNNVLKCGHAYCLNCIKDFGEASKDHECHWVLQSCILCGTPAETTRSAPYTISVKPRCAGVRMLSLDGGGVRGVVELVVLRAVEDAIGFNANVPFRAFFDLIVGTSTGTSPIDS